jgi:hypothetical protein
MLYVFDYILSFWYCQYRRYEFRQPTAVTVHKAKAAVAAEEKTIK